jgi:hypothetical protein
MKEQTGTGGGKNDDSRTGTNGCTLRSKLLIRRDVFRERTRIELQGRLGERELGEIVLLIGMLCEKTG